MAEKTLKLQLQPQRFVIVELTLEEMNQTQLFSK